MSKTTDNVLLVPGESGWEIWTDRGEEGFVLRSATGLGRAGDLTGIPAGNLTMLFPVKSLTAVPMRVTSEDDALFSDLAALHAERLGLRPDPMAGQLTDVFVIAREAENTALLAVFLRPPGDGDLPPRGPKSFDISARVFPASGDTLAIWKEFGRWVFAVFYQGILVYCQATAVEAEYPDESMAREIRLSLMQLAMQGLEVDPSRVVLWTNDETTDPSILANAFKKPVEILPRPVPVLPSPLSKLLPADVRAARRAALQRRNLILGVAAAVIVYLGLIGWLCYGLWRTTAQTKDLLIQARKVNPAGNDYALYKAKWEELSPVIDLTNSPVDILNRIYLRIPPNSNLRLQVADISATEISLKGEAPTLPPVNTFSLKLQEKNTDLSYFTWKTPEPTPFTRGLEFTYTATIPTKDSKP